jgi:hypothetical protein
MDPYEVGKFLLILGGIAGLYLKMQSAVRAMAGKGEQREITNNPLNTTHQPRTATMDDVNHVAHRVTLLERRIEDHMKETTLACHDNGEKVDDLRDRMDDKFDKVTDVLGELTRAVGRLEGD